MKLCTELGRHAEDTAAQIVQGICYANTYLETSIHILPTTCLEELGLEVDSARVFECDIGCDSPWQPLHLRGGLPEVSHICMAILI